MCLLHLLQRNQSSIANIWLYISHLLLYLDSLISFQLQNCMLAKGMAVVGMAARGSRRTEHIPAT
jgi:hypothetical protein